VDGQVGRVRLVVVGRIHISRRVGVGNAEGIGVAPGRVVVLRIHAAHAPEEVGADQRFFPVRLGIGGGVVDLLVGDGAAERVAFVDLDLVALHAGDRGPTEEGVRALDAVVERGKEARLEVPLGAKMADRAVGAACALVVNGLHTPEVFLVVAERFGRREAGVRRLVDVGRPEVGLGGDLQLVDLGGLDCRPGEGGKEGRIESVVRRKVLGRCVPVEDEGPDRAGLAAAVLVVNGGDAPVVAVVAQTLDRRVVRLEGVGLVDDGAEAVVGGNLE